jgi:sialate O-acetylesterase
VGAVLAAWTSPGWALTVAEGLDPYQVYQRGSDGTATLAFSGTSDASGTVSARVLSQGGPVKGLDWQPVGQVDGGKWSASLKAVPTGGPYTIELQIKDGDQILASVESANVLVGDLWILAGQSNMQGVGNIDVTEMERSHPLVNMYQSCEVWSPAREPLHRLHESPDAAHNQNHATWKREDYLKDRDAITTGKGTGLGLAYGVEMVNQTNVPVGLVPCAHGGTSMAQWDPALKDKAGASLYGSMMRRFKAVGGKVAGVLWYQGESDANADASKVFAQKFEAFIAACRSDMGNPELPFYYVQIGRFVRDGGEADSWNRVQEDQRVLAAKIPHAAVVPAIDLELDDLIHVGTTGLRRLGRRLARIALYDQFGRADLTRGPRLNAATLEAGGRIIRVAFDGVAGGLTPGSHIGGFTVHTPDDKHFNQVYEARVDTEHPNHVILESQQPITPGMTLSYGKGLDPFCNLRDEADMAVNVFGPLPLEVASK